MMQNVKMSREGNKLVIEIDLNVEGRLSKTGRSNVIATTEGNIPVEVKLDDGSIRLLRLGLNLFEPKSSKGVVTIE